MISTAERKGKTIVKMIPTTGGRKKTIVKTNPLYKESARTMVRKSYAVKKVLQRVWRIKAKPIKLRGIVTELGSLSINCGRFVLSKRHRPCCQAMQKAGTSATVTTRYRAQKKIFKRKRHRLTRNVRYCKNLSVSVWFRLHFERW